MLDKLFVLMGRLSSSDHLRLICWTFSNDVDWVVGAAVKLEANRLIFVYFVSSGLKRSQDRHWTSRLPQRCLPTNTLLLSWRRATTWPPPWVSHTHTHLHTHTGFTTGRRGHSGLLSFVTLEIIKVKVKTFTKTTALSFTHTHTHTHTHRATPRNSSLPAVVSKSVCVSMPGQMPGQERQHVIRV